MAQRKKKTGAPRGRSAVGGKPREHTLGVRLTSAELESITAKAFPAAPSAWLRALALGMIKVAGALALVVSIAACDAEERSACEVRAEAVCDIQVRCSGGTFDECMAREVNGCEILATCDDLDRADACAVAVADMECTTWHHTATDACNVQHWGH